MSQSARLAVRPAGSGWQQYHSHLWPRFSPTRFWLTGTASITEGQLQHWLPVQHTAKPLVMCNPLRPELRIAARWPQGTEFLLAQGADRYAQDLCGHFALDIAITNQCIEVVEILLKGDCMPYISHKKSYQTSTLPPNFLEHGLSGNRELQNTVVEALARHRHRLEAERPYHDLARNFKDSKAIAEKLFAAGFRKVEEYDEEGMTPLIRACCWGNMSMVAFLLEHGADPSRSHRDALLRAGHFFFFEADSFWCATFHGRQKGNELSPQEEAKLLQTAFDSAGCVDSRCRCSPGGFSPATSTFKVDDYEHFFVRKQSFERIAIRYVSLLG